MKVAVLGCGTVGGGVVDILRAKVDGLELKKILDVRERFNKDFIELYTCASSFSSESASMMRPSRKGLSTWRAWSMISISTRLSRKSS